MGNEQRAAGKQKEGLKRVDSFGIPLCGTDGKPIKLLRCGHIFDTTCWQMWVDSGQGNPWICPVCRQDVGRTRRRAGASRSSAAAGGGAGGEEGAANANDEEDQNREQSSLFARMVAGTAGPSMLLRPVNAAGAANYNSIQPRAQRGGTPFAPLSHPTFRRLGVHPIFGLSPFPSTEIVFDSAPGEQTPLFAQSTAVINDDDDDY